MTSKLFIALALTASPLAFAQIAQHSFVQTNQKAEATTRRSAQHQDEGDRVFRQNCARCHNAPESFSPRISGTIVRHMRVRASLSRHDEVELLRFLNP